MMTMKAMKIEVENPEHSMLIQRMLFSKGYKWYYSGERLSHIDSKYIIAKEDGRITHTNEYNVFRKDESEMVTIAFDFVAAKKEMTVAQIEQALGHRVKITELEDALVQLNHQINRSRG